MANDSLCHRLRELRCGRLARALALNLLLAALARAEIVPDGGTNILSGATSNLVGNLVVGSNAPFTLLVLTNSTDVTNTGNVTVGYSTASDSNRVVITGSGTRWVVGSNFTLGRSGSGNVLVISNSGFLSTGSATIGTTGDNNTAIVTGALWTNSGTLTLGAVGNGNRLIITNAAEVNAQNVTIGAGGFDNEVGVDAFGTLRVADTLTVGSADSNNRLRVGATGTVRVGDALTLGAGATSTGNRITVQGGVLRVTNATGTAVYDLRRGTNRFTSGTIEVDQLVMTNAAGEFEFEGGTLITRGGVIGHSNTFTVGSAGSTAAIWDVRDGPSNVVVLSNLVIGGTVANSELRITNGQTLRVLGGIDSNPSAIIGDSVAATNTRAVIAGAGSVWSNADRVWIGLNSSGNQLVVSNGGVVANGYGVLGIFSTASNNVALVTGTNSLWTNSDELHIGEFGSGNQMVVSNGGVVANSTGFLGIVSNANNNVAWVTGAGSLWTNSGSLVVGNGGSGNQLVVSNGGVVANVNGYLGRLSTGSNNLAVVTGAGSLWSNRFTLYVGNDGSGNHLVVSNSGTVRAGDVTIGSGSNSINNRLTVQGGTLRVTDTGGTGTLDIRRGTNRFASGTIEVDQLVMTNAAGVFEFFGGTLITRGGLISNSGPEPFTLGSGGATPAIWDVRAGVSNVVIASNLVIGGSVANSQLLITNGQTLRVLGGAGSNPSAVVGDGVAATNTRAIIAGASSVWSNASDLWIGNASAGNQLIVSNGGRVQNDSSYLGYESNSFNNSAVVTGTNSLWTNLGFLSVGYFGSGNQMVVSNGGVVANGSGYLGLSPTASNNVAVVTGTNSVWNNGANLYVGYYGSGNQLVVSNGGMVASRFGTLGFYTFANNNVAVVTGVGSLWSNYLDLYVGDGGSGNRLVVSNGGVVANENGYLGVNGNNNVAVVIGAGSLWSNVGDLRIGDQGSGNELVVSNGGVVNALNAFVGLNTFSTNNRVTVDGGTLRVTNASDIATYEIRRGTNVLNAGLIVADNLLLTNGALSRFDFNGGSLITRGGTISNGQDFVVGANTGFAPATWDVRSNATATTITGKVIIGAAASNATLLLTNGARLVASGGIILGNTSTATSNRVQAVGGSLTSAGLTLGKANSRGNNVTLLSNSTWNLGGQTFIWGNAGSNDTLTIDATSALTNIGALTLDENNTTFFLTNALGGYSLDGFTSNQFQFSPSGLNGVTVGNAGTGVQLLISNYTLASVQGNLGASLGANNNAVTVSGSNSVWNSGGLKIGLSGSGNTLLVANSGVVAGGGGVIGSSPSANNNAAVVTGAGSRWTNSGNLTVGDFGSGNQLVVSNGGVVANVNGSIGDSSFSANNLAVVTGTNSTWNNTGNLTVGNAGSGNQLVVSNGGTASAVNLFVGISSLGNRLTVDGGTLRVTNAGGTGTLVVQGGTNVLNAGLIEADRLILNSSAGFFTFNGGTFNVRTAAVANGTIFTVGNGTSNATYRMSGTAADVHSFANNLLINTNATLTGNGTITGSVSNFGTLAPGNSAGSIKINGSLSLQSSSKLTFELGGLIATNQYDLLTVTNFVQFAGTLSLSLINNFLPDDADTFTLVSFGSASGSFANINSGRVSLTNNLASFAVTTNATSLVIGGVTYADTDGDGQGDLPELAAGTDPNNSASYLSITAITQNASNLNVITFQSVPAKTYRIEYSNDLLTWPTATTNVPCTGASTQWIDDGTLTGGLPTTNRFYRIGLQ